MQPINTSHSSMGSYGAYSKPIDIALAVELAFAWATDLDGRYIFVSSHEGTITLTGWVSTHAEKALAADIAGTVPGVASVYDELAVLL